VIIHTHLENIVLIQKNIALKVAHPPETRDCKGSESQGASRVSETNKRGTKKLSTYALPSEIQDKIPGKKGCARPILNM